MKYTNGPPKLNKSATNITDSPTMLFGLNIKGRTWKKNRGPRSSLDMLGLSIMTMMHMITTRSTTTAIIQAPPSSRGKHSSHLKNKRKIRKRHLNIEWIKENCKNQGQIIFSLARSNTLILYSTSPVVFGDHVDMVPLALSVNKLSFPIPVYSVISWIAGGLMDERPSLLPIAMTLSSLSPRFP